MGVAEQDQLAHGIPVEGVSATVGRAGAKRKPSVEVALRIAGIPLRCIPAYTLRFAEIKFCDDTFSSHDNRNPFPKDFDRPAFLME
jgi:hypothetical protein